jgi:DNA-binding XRE family transcriptional regulator
MSTDETPVPPLPPDVLRALAQGAESWQLLLMAPDHLRALVLKQATQLRQHEAAIAELRRLVQQHQETIDRERRERERLGVELLAMRRARGQVPRTVGDLREWREARGVTQAEAAKLLHVGRATIERAEAEDHDSPLRPALRQAFARDEQALTGAEDDARCGLLAPVGTANGAKASRGAPSRSRAERTRA